MKTPEHIQAKVDAHSQTVEASQKGKRTAEARIVELEAELAAVQSDLNEAMSVTLANPTAANEAAETKLRKKAAELEMSLVGARERSRYAGTAVSSEHKGLAIDAIKTAREYVIAEWADKKPEKLQAITDAKLAYLRAMAEFGELQRDLTDLFMDTARETNANYIEDAGGVPHLNDPNWGHRGHGKSDGHLYTVTEDDMNLAMKGEFK